MGGWEERQLAERYLRPVNARFQQHVLREEPSEVEKIVGRHFFCGILEYEVQWKDGFENTWCQADTLACLDLIEEFEQNNT